MPQSPGVDPTAFMLRRGSVGCLLIHGLTGSAAELRPLGEDLAQRDITVQAVLLPGHGQTPAHLMHTSSQEWCEAVVAAYEQLRSECEEVYVAGFSMGSLLALHVAAHHPVAGLVLLSPALCIRNPLLRLAPLLRHLKWSIPKDRNPEHSDLTDPNALKRSWSYDVWPLPAVYQFVAMQRLARAEVGRVTAPSLIVRSVNDMVIAPETGRVLFAGLGSADKEEMILYNSGHALIVDSEAEAVFEAAYRWIVAHSPRLSLSVTATILVS